MNERTAPRSFSASGLHIWAMIFMAAGIAANCFLNQIMPDSSIAIEDLRALLTENPKLFVHYLTALLGRALEVCALPLLAFLLVEGFAYTSNFRNYLLRVAGLAVLSEVPYNLVTAGALLDLSSLNPVFGVLMSLLLLHFSRRYCNEDGETTTGTRVLLTAFLMFLSICIFRISPLGLSVIVLTSVMDAFRENTRAMTLWSIVACVACVFFSPFFIFAPLAFLLLKRYDEEKGELNPWIKYLVYPTMLVAFYFAFPLLFL